MQQFTAAGRTGESSLPFPVPPCPAPGLSGPPFGPVQVANTEGVCGRVVLLVLILICGCTGVCDILTEGTLQEGKRTHGTLLALPPAAVLSIVFTVAEQGFLEAPGTVVIC